ncbi:hypothetical protein M3Y94_00160400 [Aphelenchoides besseyi]|nr:hypothetical protein M3Y94_00160400 [Aphelenchoides besseyi]KAI6237076.1 Post-GPI attachment to proteins factor 2-like [Aphelenchoides besseyi]
MPPFIGQSITIIASSDSSTTPTTTIADSETDGGDESIKPLIQSSTIVSLARLSFRQLFLLTMVPSITALLSAFILGFGWDYAELLNYDWTCGRVLLPSISRIINLPKERVIFHLGMVLHGGIRPIFMAQSYLINSRVAKHSSQFTFVVKIAAILAFIAGLVELGFTFALTFVGERENGPLHCVFFIGFLIACGASKLLGLFCCRFSQAHSVDSLVRFGLRVRVGLITTIALLVPGILVCFVLYWQSCIRIAYEFFACLEYITIITIYASHIATILELRHFECHIIRKKR